MMLMLLTLQDIIIQKEKNHKSNDPILDSESVRLHTAEDELKYKISDEMEL